MSNLQENQLFANRYLLLSRLGSGAFSEVWKAQDTIADQLVVAIKIYAPDKGMDEDGIAVFSQEFSLVFNISHQNLLRPNHFDVFEGSPYLVLPYCEKGNTAKLVGKLDESQIVKFIHDVASGLAFLHEQNPPIIHQDIKPDNILLTDHGDFIITDFGISTRIRSTLRRSVNNTYSGGTMAFMAPERFDRNPMPIKANDIWSLGAAAYELMTGDAPFGNMGGVALKNGAEIPENNGPYSTELKELVEKCLSKEPWDRPMAHQIIEKTENYIKHGTWNSEPVPVPKPRKFFSKKNKIIIFSLLILVFLSAGLWIWDYNRVKVVYYKDYIEQWGVPQGIGKVSKKTMKHRQQTYRFEYKKRKLQRVSFVNSRGNLVEHHDSEHMERATDMQIFYTDKGVVDYVKYLDRSGRVLFRKDYNDKLNVVTFQYDDEYGTELTLSARTLKMFSNPYSSDDEGHGNISRYLLTYNDKGEVVKLEYAGFQNVKLSDKDGIMGRKFVLDEKGRVVEEHFLGCDGKPKATSKGLAIKKHKFIENDDWVETSYYTINGEYSTDETGIPIVRLEYDEYGNRIKESYFNEQGELIYRTDTKSAGFSYQYDENGYNIARSYFDTDGKKSYGIMGFVTQKMEYDANGYESKWIFCDENDKIIPTSNGYSSISYANDNKGNILEMWFWDENNQLFEVADGYAGAKMKYDSIGNLIEYITYDIQKKPCLQTDETAGYRAQYNTFNKIKQLTYLNKDLAPCKNENGIVSWKTDFDKRGNQTKISFYDADNKLLLSNENIAGWNSVYDDNGNEIERSFFDTNSKICMGISNYAKWIAKYDGKGNQVEIMYYGTDGKLIVTDDGYAGKIFKYDDRSNLLEEFPVNTAGGLADNKLILKYKYDASDNQVEMSVFQSENKPALNGQNWHSKKSKYNGRNQIIEISYFGIDGKLTNYSNDRYSIQQYTYDTKGNRLTIKYLNKDRQPVECNEGWASSKYEYDSQNRLIRQLFFNKEGNFTDPQKMVPEGIVKYDKWGNIVYIASADGKGNIINNPQKGCAIQKYEYNLRGNLCWEAAYDLNNKLCNLKGQSYSKIVYTYNQKGNQTEERYFASDGNLRTADYAIVKYDYDENNRLKEMTFYNHQNQKTVFTGEIHKIVNIYENNTKKLIFRKYYKKNDALLATWNAKTEEWDFAEEQNHYQSPIATPTNDWKNYFDIALPYEWDESTVVTKVICNDKGCTMTFKLIEESQYSISDSEMANYKQYFRNLVNEHKVKSKMPSNATMQAIVIDRVERELFRVSK